MSGRNLADAPLEWLSGLRQMSDGECDMQARASLRILPVTNCLRLGVECRGFLLFLENAGILDAACREMIVERAPGAGRDSKSNSKT